MNVSAMHQMCHFERGVMRLAGKMSANRAAILAIAGFLAAPAAFGVAHAYPGRTAPSAAPPVISSKT